MSSIQNFGDLVNDLSDGEATDMDNVSAEEEAAAADEETATASETEEEEESAAEPPKKVMKKLSIPKAAEKRPTESGSAAPSKKRRAPETDKPKSSDKAAASRPDSDERAPKRTSTGKKTASSAPRKQLAVPKSQPKPATPVPAVAAPKKQLKLPVCNATVRFSIRTTTGRVTTVTGRGASAVSSCFRSLLVQFNAMSTAGKRVVVQSATCSLLPDAQEGTMGVELMTMEAPDQSVTLDVVFKSFWEMYRGQYQCDPLFDQDGPASA